MWRLYKKADGTPAVPSYLGHVLTENRNGLVVGSCATQSSTTAEREAALALLAKLRREDDTTITLGADKQYQDADFIAALRERGVIPHVAEYETGVNQGKNSLRPEERDSPGFAVSQRKRKRVEQVFGWFKLNRVLHQVKLRGRQKIDWLIQLVAAAHNLRRMQRLIYAQ